MSFRIIYKNLFEIRILHHYFLDRGEETWDSMSQEQKDKMLEIYDVRSFLEIVPSPDCAEALSAHRCVAKATATGILVGIKSEPDELDPEKFKPVYPLSPDLSFRFLVRTKVKGFSDFSAVPLNGNNSTTLFLKNYAVNTQSKFPALTSIPPVFEAGKEYLPGDMLSDHSTNQTKLFTALVKTKNGTSKASDWITEIGDLSTPLNYVNTNDYYPVVTTGIVNYVMKTTGIYPLVALKNQKQEALVPKMEIFTGEPFSFQVDLRGFQEGIYTLDVTGNTPGYHDIVTFYLLNQSPAPTGLIDIKVKSNLPGYDLLDGTSLRFPVFEIRFRNRMTHWRYSGKGFNTPYEPQDPLPLTRYGHIGITKPAEPGDSKIIMLPNPSEPVIMPEALIDKDKMKYYSDIHII